MLKVIVNRKTWHRGGGGPGSRLLREEDGMRCCIGFLAKKLGCSDSTLLEECDLQALNPCQKTDKFSNLYDSELIDAYRVNDARDLTEEQRETELRAIGLSMDVQFIFRG